MPNIRRMRVALSGAAIGGEGVITLWNTSATATGWPAAVKTFLNAHPLDFPAALTFSVPNTGDVLDVATGTLVGAWVDGPTQTSFNGANTGDYAKGVGARVVWNTGAIHSGRRVVGYNFLVPLAGGVFDSDGTLDEAFRTNWQGYAAAYLTSQAQAAVYLPPKPVRPKKSGGTLPAEDGYFAPIASATVPDRVSWLKSRRS